MVNEQIGIEASRLPSGHQKGASKYGAIYPNQDSEVTLRYAEALGLGSRAYEITEV